jgi:hypothetical protein
MPSNVKISKMTLTHLSLPTKRRDKLTCLFHRGQLPREQSKGLVALCRTIGPIRSEGAAQFQDGQKEHMQFPKHCERTAEHPKIRSRPTGKSIRLNST